MDTIYYYALTHGFYMNNTSFNILLSVFLCTFPIFAMEVDDHENYDATETQIFNLQSLSQQNLDNLALLSPIFSQNKEPQTIQFTQPVSQESIQLVCQYAQAKRSVLQVGEECEEEIMEATLKYMKEFEKIEEIVYLAEALQLEDLLNKAQVYQTRTQKLDALMERLNRK